jgi:hypothetical protein
LQELAGTCQGPNLPELFLPELDRAGFEESEPASSKKVSARSGTLKVRKISEIFVSCMNLPELAG